MLKKPPAILALFLTLAGTRLAAGNRPQFRGPEGRAVSADRRAPLEWSHDKNIAWKAPIPGRGLEAQTGKVLYEGGRPPEPSRFMASMVAVGDRILQTSEDGDVFVVRTGTKHEVLATNSVGEPVQVSPAIANGRIYIRGEKHLFAIGR